MKMRDIQVGEDYAVRVPNAARAPRSGGSRIVRATVDDCCNGKVYVFGGTPARVVRPDNVVALWDDYAAKIKATVAWPAAFAGIEQNGADLGEILRESAHLNRHVLATETLEAIAERINSLSAVVGGENTARDTGLSVTHLHFLPGCRLKDEESHG